MKPVDLYMLYSFIRRLSTPFTDWKMFHVGLIDEDGNFLVPKDKRTPEQEDCFSYFDLLILNLKKIIAKVPGGSTRIATFAAALFLLREGKPVSEKSVNVRSTQFQESMTDFISEARIFLTEDEGGAPTNNIGSGHVANKDQGLGKKVLKRKLTEKRDNNA